METSYVREMMSSPVISVPPTIRLPAIKHLMRAHKIRHLPVVVGGKLVGIISLGDVRNAFPSDAGILSIYEVSHLLDNIIAADIMRTGVVTIEAEAPLVEAAWRMLDHKIGGLPVLEGNRLVGMITESDLFRAMIVGQGGLATAVATAKTTVPISPAGGIAP